MQTTTDSRSDSRTTWVEDDALEAAVLRNLLDLHPTRLTRTELRREMGGDRGGFAECDAIERAMRELTAAGLLHEEEEFVTPTRAALRLCELLEH